MSATLLVTPDTDFEDQVKRAFDGELDAERWWDGRLARLPAETAAREIAYHQPEVAVIGPGVPAPVAVALAEALDHLFPEVCVVLVLQASRKVWEQALRAGVREIIAPGADDVEVGQALTRAGSAAARRHAGAAGSVQAQQARAPRARVITVMSPKGGAGKTTVATNLATQLAALAPGRVAIVDLDLQFGDVASALGLGPQSTMADAARAEGKLDSTAIKVFLEPHPSGLYALAAPHFPAEADEVSASTAGHIVDIVAGEFSFVVVDTGAGLDEYTLAAIERSDDLVLVCVTDVPSVRGMRKALDAIDLLGMTRPRRHLVLNRSDDKVGLTAGDVEATIGLPVEASVPTSRAIQISINQGEPIVQSDPRSAPARALAALAARFVDEPAPAVVPTVLPEGRPMKLNQRLKQAAATVPSGPAGPSGAGAVRPVPGARRPAPPHRHHRRRSLRCHQAPGPGGALRADGRPDVPRRHHRGAAPPDGGRGVGRGAGGRPGAALRRRAPVAVGRDHRGRPRLRGPRGVPGRSPGDRDHGTGTRPIYVERQGRLFATESRFLVEAHLRRVIERIVGQVGRRIDESSPMVDARLPDGSRVNAVLPPLALDGPTLTIRKFSEIPFTVADLTRLRTLTPRLAELACLACWASSTSWSPGARAQARPPC